jgi:hypothetical protein
MNLLDRFREIQDYSSFSKLLYEGEESQAVAIFPRLRLSNGLKPIALARLVNALMRLDRYGRAISAYEEAVSAELNWAGRKQKSDSQYLIAYCEFFAEVSRSRLESREFNNWHSRLAYLDCLPVSRHLKRHELPLPFLLS